MEDARVADEADVGRLAELAGRARDELRPLRGGDLFLTREARSDPLEASFAADIADADALVLCGTIDEVIVGYGVVRAERLGDGRVLGRIDDLYVEAGGREVGVGERLMEELLAWCAARGCVGVDAIALPGARETKNFFEGSGFSARLLVMHHRMSP